MYFHYSSLSLYHISQLLSIAVNDFITARKDYEMGEWDYDDVGNKMKLSSASNVIVTIKTCSHAIPLTHPPPTSYGKLTFA